ncbi:MAG: PAS domain-containing protein [Gemmatimonadaceae bacterium]|nr:PAS domain-containing protein [Gemmatimonadaceae bacterium]
MLATLLPLLSDGLLISRADGYIEHANPAACELLGRPESALQGVHESEVWRPREDHDVLGERRVGAVIHGRATITRPDGAEGVIEYLSTVVAKGESQQACTLLRPIRDPAHLSEELDRQARRFRTMFNGLREAVCFLTPIRGADGAIVSFAFPEANDAMQRQMGVGPLSGRSMEEVLGSSVFHARVADRVQRYSAVLRTGEAWEYEVRTNGRVNSIRVFRHSDDTIGVTSIDLTEQLETVRALTIAEQRGDDTAEELRAVLDAVPAAVWIARDVQANHIDSNAYGQRLLRTAAGANVSITAPVDERPRHFTQCGMAGPSPKTISRSSSPLASAALFAMPNSICSSMTARSDICSVAVSRCVMAPDGFAGRWAPSSTSPRDAGTSERWPMRWRASTRSCRRSRRSPL